MGILRALGLSREVAQNPSQLLAVPTDRGVRAVSASPAVAARFATEIDSGVLYGTPTLDDYIYGRLKISRAEALAVPAVKRARDLICGGIGQFPLILVGPDGKTVEWSLLSQPEAGVARSVTITRTVEDLLLSERAWWKVTHTGWHNRPAEVVRLEAETVTVQPKYVTYPYGTAHVWPVVEDLIRIDSPNGGLLNAGTAIKAYILLSRIALRAADGTPPVDWFEPAEGADPIGIPEGDETQEEADARAIGELLDAWYRARQARITAYIPAALKYQRDGFDPEKLQLAEAREFAITEIARLTGIDAEDLSVSTTSRTYFNAQDRRRSRIEDVLGPYMTAIEGRLSLDDLTPHGYRVLFDTSSYLRLDDQAAATTDQTLINAKVITSDEAREKRGLEPLGLDAPAPSEPSAVPAVPAEQEATP